MTNIIQITNATAGINVTDASFIHVKEGVIVSTNAGTNSAIRAQAGNSRISVNGEVVSSVSFGISTGDASEAFAALGNSNITVGMSGFVGANSSAMLVAGENNRVSNLGLVSGGDDGITFGFVSGSTSGNNTVFNSGIIDAKDRGIEFLLAGTGGGNSVTNAGSIFAGLGISGSNQAETIVNSGIIHGGLSLNGGADTVENLLGRIVGIIDLGSGDDSYLGGSDTEKVLGGSGADTVDLGGGSDSFIAKASGADASDGNDDLDGGDGRDTYNAGSISTALDISLTDNRASGASIGVDSVFGFENINGGSASDTLEGDAAVNWLRGKEGADTISGLAGNDRLIGDDGADKLTGGTGRDVMTGGADVDVFDFNSTTESTTGAGRDIITDFQVAVDDIDLSTIDANTITAGNQAFSFIASGAFTNAAGQLRFTTNAVTNSTLVEADTGGDGKADFAILLFGQHTLTSGDFVL